MRFPGLSDRIHGHRPTIDVRSAIDRALAAAPGLLLRLILLSQLLPASVPCQAASDIGFKVIMNSSAAATPLTRAELSDLFLRKKTSWPGGAEVLPVDLPTQSPVREDFSRVVLGRRPGAVRSYWQQQIFSGRGSPPLQLSSDSEVVDYVRVHKGTIGYVAVSTDTRAVSVVTVSP